MYLDTILIKVASICNLNCSYCYVYHGEDVSYKEQPSLMTEEVIEKIVAELTIQASKQERGFSIVLHGGEPLLLGFSLMKKLLMSLRQSLPNSNKYPISIQSNGVLIDDKFIELLINTSSTISISLDGFKSINDLARVDHHGNSTFTKVISKINLLSTYPDVDDIFTGILSVIHPSSSPIALYDFYKKLPLKSVNFLLQDGNHNRLPLGKNSYLSTEYGTWIDILIKHYLSDEEPTFVIPFIDDLIKVSLGGSSVKEGISENNFSILIVETDGEYRKNDTLRTTYNGADFLDERPNIMNTTLLDILKSEEFKESCKMQTSLPQECKECTFVHICGGGMPLYRWSSANGYNNPSVYCKDHQVYISSIKSILEM